MGGAVHGVAGGARSRWLVRGFRVGGGPKRWRRHWSWPDVGWRWTEQYGGAGGAARRATWGRPVRRAASPSFWGSRSIPISWRSGR